MQISANYKLEMAKNYIKWHCKLSKEVEMVSAWMKVKNVVHTKSVIEPNNEFFDVKRVLDDIVHSQFQKSIYILLSFIFLRI